MTGEKQELQRGAAKTHRGLGAHLFPPSEETPGASCKGEARRSAVFPLLPATQANGFKSDRIAGLLLDFLLIVSACSPQPADVPPHGETRGGAGRCKERLLQTSLHAAETHTLQTTLTHSSHTTHTHTADYTHFRPHTQFTLAATTQAHRARMPGGPQDGRRGGGGWRFQTSTQ